jgi:ribonuclease P protein component
VIYETTIPALEEKTEAAARIPQPQFVKKRPRNPEKSAPDGAQTPDAGLIVSGMGAGTPGGFGFNRGARIKKGRDFSRIRQEGQRLVSGCLIANWRVAKGETPSRLGVITSSRIGNAVVRSRARRVLREAFRLHQNDLRTGVELVLIARNSIVGKGLADVERDFLTILQKAGLSKQG